jgi:hypothetical protein
MQATKALFWVVVLAAGVACIVFVALPQYRPAFVKAWLRQASGFTPAKTASEAVEKFREAIRKRDYETAALYTGGEYKQYLEMGAEKGTKLGNAIDDLVSNVDTVGINSPDSKFVLFNLEPFPKDFEFNLTPSISARDYDVLSKAFPNEFPAGQMKSLGDKVAVGVIKLTPVGLGEAKPGRMNLNPGDPKITMAFVPLGPAWDGIVGLKEEGNDKETGWKIFVPLLDVRQKVDYLKQNGGNYVRGLENVKYAIKHDAAAKSDFERELVKQITEAK